MSEPTEDTEPEIIELTGPEYEAAIEATLLHLGLTRDGLAAQAAEDDFESPAAFMMWHTIRDRD